VKRDRAERARGGSTSGARITAAPEKVGSGSSSSIAPDEESPDRRLNGGRLGAREERSLATTDRGPTKEHPREVALVEDETLLRVDAVSAVEEGGYIAYEAANADEEIRVFEGRKDMR
jgi:hypothetical protein